MTMIGQPIFGKMCFSNNVTGTLSIVAPNKEIAWTFRLASPFEIIIRAPLRKVQGVKDNEY